MLKQRRAQTKKIANQKTVLYRYVFDSVSVKWATLFIFGFLILQPAAPVFASTLSEEQVSVENQETLDPIILEQDVQAAETVDTQLSSEEIAVEGSSSEDDAITLESEASSIELEMEASASLQPDEVSQDFTDASLVVDENADDEIADVATSTIEVEQNGGIPEASLVDENSFVATSTVVQVEIPENEVLVPSVPLESEQNVATSSASSSEEVTVEMPFYAPQSAAFEFDTKECASVGDGAYYCSSVDDVVDPLTDSVFSAPDSDGDLEIYVRLGGKENVITSNTVDDSAPYFDALSKRIVWHRVIDDRYQIISYDTATNKETVLTHTSYNNMEPVAYGEITLWQAWIDTNWEIMFSDGHTLQQLTNNIQQDVSPHMREGYIVWQTQFSDGWQVAVYNQETKAIEYIPSEGGLKVENPRFVLVYDSTDDNGDTQTLGYDLDAKISFNLGSLPAQLPEKLPEPDQTGETRALIQNKQTSREGETEIIDVIGNATASSSSAVQDSSTLDLSQNQASSTVATTTVTSIADIVDVVIPSYTSTSTENQAVETFEDIVIPPFSTSTIEEVS